jgi:hypothetical protein
MDASLAGGLALAAVAAACFDIGYALQAVEARRAPREQALRAGLLIHLLQRPIWLGATALSVAGWPIQVLALTLAPLTLVQPTLALGLLLLLYLGHRILREPVGARELTAVAVIIAAVTAIALAAPTETGEVDRGAGLVIVIALLLGAAVLPFALKAVRGLPSAWLLVAAAGCADGLAALVAKLVAEDGSDGRWLAVVPWIAIAGGVVVLGVISESSALQRLPATRVAPTVLAMQILVPTLLAPVIGGEDWGSTPGGGAVLIAAIAALGAGIVILGSSRAVAGIVAEAETAPGG